MTLILPRGNKKGKKKKGHTEWTNKTHSKWSGSGTARKRCLFHERRSSIHRGLEFFTIFVQLSWMTICSRRLLKQVHPEKPIKYVYSGTNDTSLLLLFLWKVFHCSVILGTPYNGVKRRWSFNFLNIRVCFFPELPKTTAMGFFSRLTISQLRWNWITKKKETVSVSLL